MRAEVSALHKAGQQAQAELVRGRERATSVAMRRARLREVISSSEAVIHQGQEDAHGPGSDVEEASRRLVAQEQRLAAQEEARRSADAERHRWSARAEALTQALDEARARAGPGGWLRSKEWSGRSSSSSMSTRAARRPLRRRQGRPSLLF